LGLSSSSSLRMRRNSPVWSPLRPCRRHGNCRGSYPTGADIHGDVARDALRHRLVFVRRENCPRRREVHGERTHGLENVVFAKSAKRVRLSCGRGSLI
jgi:hypothetical protein